MSYVSGGRVRRMAVRRTGETLGETHFGGAPGDSPIGVFWAIFQSNRVSLLERNIKVLYAGAIAESIAAGEERAGMRQNDFTALKAYIEKLAEKKDLGEPETAELSERLKNETIESLSANWDAVRRLSKELQEKRVLRGREARRVMSSH